MNFKELTDKITELGDKYQRDYGIMPFNVCLGPELFALISKEQNLESGGESIPEWHFKAAPIFYKGMRLHLLSTSGIYVGTLIPGEPT